MTGFLGVITCQWRTPAAYIYQGRGMADDEKRPFTPDVNRSLIV
jgi:hypothetical protein